MRCNGVRCRVSAGTFKICMTRIVVRCRFAERHVGYSPSRKQFFQYLNVGGRRHRTGCNYRWSFRVDIVYHNEKSLIVGRSLYLAKNVDLNVLPWFLRPRYELK